MNGYVPYLDSETMKNLLSSKLNDLWGFGVALAEIELGDALGAKSVENMWVWVWENKNVVQIRLREIILTELAKREWTHNYGECSFFNLIDNLVTVTRAERIQKIDRVVRWLEILQKLSGKTMTMEEMGDDDKSICQKVLII